MSTADLYFYQLEAKNECYKLWQTIDVKNILLVLPTGAGKTHTFCSIIDDFKCPTMAIAHRKELVGQMSLTLAKRGIRHRVMASKADVAYFRSRHIKFTGECWIDANAPVIVASVGKLLAEAKKGKIQRLCAQIRLWVIDEGHHVLTKNQWGKVVALFPNARGLGVTATPLRADGAGLGAEFDGVYHEMVVGPTMRDLIDLGFLCEYRFFAPETEIHLTREDIGDTGDYKKPAMVNAVKGSTIVGDVVGEYLKYGAGLRGITFVPSVETAVEVANLFKAQGIPAMALSAKTNPRLRNQALEQFERGELMQLVNVDLFGEGFDVPAASIIQFARPTMSYGLYVQQFGRGLRTMDGKERAIIIDHVGNWRRHGLPDYGKQWSLARRDKKSQNSASSIQLRTCKNLECQLVYEIKYKACPHCGTVHVYENKTEPKFVDGDITELTKEDRDRIYNKILIEQRNADITTSYMKQSGANQLHIAHAQRSILIRQKAQRNCAHAIGVWGACEEAAGTIEHVRYQKFNQIFCVDVLNAQLLKTKDSNLLTERIYNDLRSRFSETYSFEGITDGSSLVA